MTVAINVILIFVLRVLNYALGTLRLVSITRGMKTAAAALAAIEALVFAVVIAGVVSDLQNLPNLLAYCLGASAGSWVGMELESRLVRSYTIVNIFANQKGFEITEALRGAGYGVTTTLSQGKDGDVVTLRSVVDKRDVKVLVALAHDINPAAFVAVEEARGIQRGWLGVGRGGKLVG
ncbi:MAG: hypothetical protein EA396_10780 [Anaerolineaceae bacterium]|nr:MAG: hypothetical protein EA396_10780 [Anaerolineaceae bacterium]